MAAASTKLTVGRKHVGKTFGTICKTDPGYCKWALGESMTGNSSKNLDSFAQYVRSTRGDILRFGRHAGRWYSDVLSSDPSYGEWAASCPSPSGQLADFATFARRAKSELDWSSDSESENPCLAKKKRSLSTNALSSESDSDCDSDGESDSDSESSLRSKNKRRKLSAARLKADAQKAKKQAKKAKNEVKKVKALATKARQETRQARAEAEQAKADAKDAAKKAKAAAGKTAKPPGKADSEECKVCMDAPVETVFVPCGHLVACLSCSGCFKGKQSKCPICRKCIKQVVRTYKA